MASDAIHILDEPRHTCLSCGGCCQGTKVVLVGDEAERIAAYAAELEIEAPIEDGRIAMVEGRCPFLADDRLCKIHRRHGPQAKPTVCQQFPVIATRVDEGIRLGIDPGCYSTIRTWRDAEPIGDASLLASPVKLHEGQEVIEDRLLDLCDAPDITLARLAGVLAGEPAPEGGGLPPAFAGRWVELLQRTSLSPLLEDPDTAPQYQRTLSPIIEAIPRWDADAPPPWPALDDESEAFALEVIQRSLFLRLHHTLPLVAGSTLLLVGGVLAAAWATDSRDDFGAALAAWTRSMRSPSFLGALVPDPGTMAWLARGLGEPPTHASP